MDKTRGMLSRIPRILGISHFLGQLVSCPFCPTKSPSHGVASLPNPSRDPYCLCQGAALEPLARAPYTFHARGAHRCCSRAIVPRRVVARRLPPALAVDCCCCGCRLLFARRTLTQLFRLQRVYQLHNLCCCYAHYEPPGSSFCGFDSCQSTCC
eukprot:TRINITY_DN5814_c0_g1_i1.p1 TRINITY_DN5814_c0_g1~~TRINITY_DN5814_c0_g1_i1.p1  ORF type:complete len:179 (+),score=7.37 TRINITY_DN5814_c0_g1_i1:78-539(+)